MISLIQRTFAGGELAPAVYARADLAKYQTGARTLRNFFVGRHGGAINRPGTEFICAVKDSSKTVRLIKFVFNASQTYVLEFGNLYMRVIRDGAQVESAPGVPYEIVTPYLEADLLTLQFIQSADVVTIVHPTYAPRELTRTAHTSWTLATITFTPSIAAPGSVINSGAAGATNSWVVTTIKAETFEESVASTATTAAAATVTVSWAAVAGAQEYNVYKQINGIYGFIGTAGGTSFVDGGITPDTTGSPPVARTLFASATNYPSTVSYFQQRRCFANTDTSPEKIWASKSGMPKNFSISSPLQDDDAVTFSISGRQVNEVRFLLEVGKLVVLTSGGEWTVDGAGDGVLTPTAINLKQQGYSGCAEIAPIVISNSALFVQARGTIVRDLRYDLQTDGYNGRDLSIFANHLFEGYTLVDWDYQQIPHSVVWAVRSDGTLLGLTYVREHEVWGWHRHDTGDGDTFERVCSIPEGTEDAVYVVVKRTVDGETVRYIERLHSRLIGDLAADAFFVDSGLSYDGRHTGATTMTVSSAGTWTVDDNLTLTASVATFAAGDVGTAEYVLRLGAESVRCIVTAYTSTTIVTVKPSRTVPVALRAVAAADWGKALNTVTGLGHLEGRTLSVLGDGSVEPQVVVSASGTIELSHAYELIHAGLPIEADLETLDPESVNAETIADKKKHLTSVTLRVESSRGIFAGPDEDHLYEYKQRTTETYGEATALTTGLVEVPVLATWNNHGRTLIRQSDPLPLTVLAVIPNGQIGG